MTTQATRPQLTYRTVQVTSARRIAPRLTRVTFTGTDLRDFTSVAPDQYVKVFFPPEGHRRPRLPPPVHGDDTVSWYRTYLAMPDGVRPPMRTYTVRAHRPEARELDIDFVLHADPGPASAWAERAEPGDEVALLGPHGLYAVPEGTSWQLLVGDESAIPAIGALLEALPDGAAARVFVEVEGPEDELDLATRGEVDLRWVHRSGAAHGQAVLAAVRAADLPAGQPYAWLAGESSLVRFTRRHLVRERGVDKRAITFCGYWRRGASEEDAGRENLRKLDAGEPLEEEE
ncbi:NADPH-dependent ferric siderophore reductase [Prauserella shujinwangii]|uniref:NADPH-dependent ferric siderophore reductase n=1 Tax=Prauserella shujinwangii TaxID=1453103 RepID=A0A2T0LMC4_9PSEU|nr:siderophore-interacting protein [Prauserella shujinwangii]PRX44190.1 NADPH-dependent ferric siderophore reductase [Prauserella shujinwangii]